MVHGTHLFVLSIDIHTGLKAATVVGVVVVALTAVVAKNGANFSQCSIAWGNFHGLEV
jgi:hypothetical protein